MSRINAGTGLAVALGLLALAGCRSEQAPFGCAVVDDPEDREGAWKADIECAVDVIEKRHPNPYTVATAGEFTAEAARLKEAIRSRSDEQMLLGLAELVSLVNDGHTVVHSVYDHFTELPVRFAWFEDGIYAVNAPAEIHDRVAGAPLIMIEGVALADIKRNLAQLVAKETDVMAESRVAGLLNRPGILLQRGFGSDPDTARYYFEGKAEAVVVDRSMSVPVPVSLADEHELPMSYLDREKYYWADTDSARSLLYIQYNRCASSPEYPFSIFVDDVVAMLESEPVDRVLIDLRTNLGGASSVIDPLIAALAESRQGANGNIYVAIGPDTFSSALLNAAQLKLELDATILGSQTGERVNHFGELETQVLPNTGTVLGYSTKHFVLHPDGDGPLVPDVRLPYRGADFVRGIDPVLDYFDTH